MSTKGTVRLEGLRKEFDDVVAVNGIDLEIHSGEFFTVLGPSGCGKTTTLRCLAGLETPTSGNVFISGENVTRLPANKRNTSIVFQRWALFPHMSVAKNIEFGLEMDGVPKDERKRRVEDVLELVEMPGYQDRKPSELSGGQKQRVAMARSIVREPDVLLLDEPLASLDRALRERLQVELKKIQDELEITFVHVTHDQEEALSMSDRIAVMNDGRLEQVGSATDLYEHPNSRFVAEFLGETNLFDGSVVHESGRLIIDGSPSIRLDTAAHDADEVGSSSIAYTVRPESLYISDGGLDCENAWEGTVESAIYKGSNILYEVDVGDRIVRVQQQRSKSIDVYEEGSQVTVGFDSDAGELIRETEGTVVEAV